MSPSPLPRVSDVCPTCKGEGEVHFNPSRRGDPQCEDSALCPACHGTGHRHSDHNTLDMDSDLRAEHASLFGERLPKGWFLRENR